MQNKGAILVLAVVLVIVSIYQLSFTGVTYKVKQDAKEYAQGDLNKELHYLDSIAGLPKDKWSFLGNTFRECQQKEINLGLDLKGGMNVILEVSVPDIIKALSNYSKDTTFLKALKLAEEYQKSSSEDFVTLFGKAFEEIAPGARLAAIFNTMELKDKIDFNSTNEDVLKVLHKEVQDAIDNSFLVLSNRIDRFGVVQPTIQRLSTQGRIMIELPGVKDPSRVRKLLQETANLEFWETYENSEVGPYFVKANELLRQILSAQKEQKDSLTAAKTPATQAAANEKAGQEKNTTTTESDSVSASDSLLKLLESDTSATAKEQQSFEAFKKENPLFAVLRPNTTRDGKYVPGSVVGYAVARDTAIVNKYLNMKQVRALFPRNLIFRWHFKPYKYAPGQNLFELHALKVTTRDGRAPLTGEVITSAREEFDQNTGQARVTMSMNAEGSKVWARLTRENVGRAIAIVLDNYVYSAPRVNSEIKGGNSEITGDFTIDEAKDLANMLKSGKMPAPAKIIQEAVVGPTLGQEAIKAGLNSFLIAFLVVLLFMIVYYSPRAGLVADLALFLNVFFILGVLASLGAVLTLPGIAGIVLTVGMSVDANVLIYERIKEEMRAGKGIKKAISEGYRNAYSAIIDANATTFFTGVILYIFGTGPIKGFATTLVIGILTSLFSAIFITRLVFERMLTKNSKITFFTRLTEKAFSNLNFKFIEKRKMAYVISGTFLVISIVSLSTRGLSPGIDFTGGRTYVVRFDKAYPTQDIQQALAKVFGKAPEVKVYGNVDQMKITTQFMIDDPSADDLVDSTLYVGLKPFLGDNVDFQTFQEKYKQSSQTVGPTIAYDIKVQAMYAVLLALIFMFLYIMLRFRNWRFGFGAVGALIHDSLIVLGVFSLFYGKLPFSMEIDQSFIAAILTVIGYSVNDTVVVFDRIREYLKLYPKRAREEVLDAAVNSTIGRTINTSLSTIIVLLVVFLFGGEVIRGFIFAMLIGVFVGTYSSIFVATPLVYDTMKDKVPEQDKKGKEKKKLKK
jgi:SecD/SecF fusion protein